MIDIQLEARLGRLESLQEITERRLRAIEDYINVQAVQRQQMLNADNDREDGALITTADIMDWTTAQQEVKVLQVLMDADISNQGKDHPGFDECKTWTIAKVVRDAHRPSHTLVALLKERLGEECLEAIEYIGKEGGVFSHDEKLKPHFDMLKELHLIEEQDQEDLWDLTESGKRLVPFPH